MSNVATLFGAAVLLTCSAVRLAPAQRAPASASGSIPQLALRLSVPFDKLGHHAPAWSGTDVALASAFLATLWVDASQTRSLASQGWSGFRETNPLIGPRPSVGQINTYTAVAAVTTLGVAAVLRPRARRWWLATAFAVEALTVASTTRIGVGFTVR